MTRNRPRCPSVNRYGSLERRHLRLALAARCFRCSRQLSRSIVSARCSRVPRVRRSRQRHRGRGRDRAKSPRTPALVHFTRPLFRNFSQDAQPTPALTPPTGTEPMTEPMMAAIQSRSENLSINGSKGWAHSSFDRSITSPMFSNSANPTSLFRLVQR